MGKEWENKYIIYKNEVWKITHALHVGLKQENAIEYRIQSCIYPKTFIFIELEDLKKSTVLNSNLTERFILP